jgi:hypothetical protein
MDRNCTGNRTTEALPSLAAPIEKRGFIVRTAVSAAMVAAYMAADKLFPENGSGHSLIWTGHSQPPGTRDKTTYVPVEYA